MTASTVLEPFHYPPELFNLLVDTIPLLNRSKRDVLMFFRGAGVSTDILNGLDRRLTNDPQSVSKYAIVRTVLKKLNTRGDVTLLQRREVLRRVIEFENFDTCWPNDQLKAKGLVSGVREVVDHKDSFTRMRQERERERSLRQAAAKEELSKKTTKLARIEAAKKKLFRLFGSKDTPQSRGIRLEDSINSLFEAYDVLIQDSFRRVSPTGEGVVEQIDGVIEFQGHVYFVEMKWHNEPIGNALIAQHLVKLMSRSEARGIFISASGYTDTAISTCRDFLQHKLVILVHLKEIVDLLDGQKDMSDLLESKIRAAQIQKDPGLGLS